MKTGVTDFAFHDLKRDSRDGEGTWVDNDVPLITPSIYAVITIASDCATYWLEDRGGAVMAARMISASPSIVTSRRCRDLPAIYPPRPARSQEEATPMNIKYPKPELA